MLSFIVIRRLEMTNRDPIDEPTTCTGNLELFVLCTCVKREGEGENAQQAGRKQPDCAGVEDFSQGSLQPALPDSALRKAPSRQVERLKETSLES